MVRRFDDPVQVRSAEGPSRRPEAFIWRGRLYVVRTVLGQWRERRAWWRDAFDAGPAAGSGEASGSDGMSPALTAAATEQQIWRIEASPGWSFAPGVYDLAQEPAADPAHADHWSLVRVAD